MTEKAESGPASGRAIGTHTQGGNGGAIRLSLPTVMIIGAVLSAGAFAAGRATSSSAAAAEGVSGAATISGGSAPELDPPGHNHGGVSAADLPGHGNDTLPPGHPAVDPGADPGMAAGMPGMAAAAPTTALEWKAPPRWQLLPNTSSMRLATYRIPSLDGAAGKDAELSIAQAGGSIEANADRWIGQFDESARKTAKQSKRKVGTLEVTIVEVEGTFSGGMGPGPTAKTGWALLGAIVATPSMPHFFKITGPAATVKNARAELDALVGSLVQP